MYEGDQYRKIDRYLNTQILGIQAVPVDTSYVYPDRSSFCIILEKKSGFRKNGLAAVTYLDCKFPAGSTNISK